MKNQYKVQITKYALAQMKEIRDYIANELLAPQAAYNLILEMKMHSLFIIAPFTLP